jgi:hypothetical protein
MGCWAARGKNRGACWAGRARFEEEKENNPGPVLSLKNIFYLKSFIKCKSF